MFVEHWGIMARDPVSLARWYTEALDMTEYVRASDDGPVFIIDNRGGIIEFFPVQPGVSYPGDMDRKVSHIAIGVEDFDSAVDRVGNAGGELAPETMEIFDGGKVRFFRDPEGNWLHLVWRPASLREIKERS